VPGDLAGGSPAESGGAVTADVISLPDRPAGHEEPGKLPEPTNLAEEIRDSGFRELPITVEHAILAGRLPLIHRDPFDRMLVAQAQCEGLTLASRDPHVRQYDVALLWV
jgi:PIN domain nuclease of toxin-antitoxin system